MKHLLVPSSAYINGEILDNVSVLTDGGLIAAVYMNGEKHYDKSVYTLNLPNLLLAPGFIDTHIHGYAGYDVADGFDSLSAVSDAVIKEGTTAFCPSFMTAPLGSTKTALAAVRSFIKGTRNGADVLGAFLEGPYISESFRGAHPAEYIRQPDTAELRELTDDGGVESVALAPEIEGAREAACFLCGRGVNVRFGHSGASSSDLIGVMNNISRKNAHTVIHVFNAMSPLSHRNPNILSEALSNNNLYTELIADFIHVSEQSAKILYRCKGAHKTILVTDSAAVAGIPGGQYENRSYRITNKDGAARTQDGTLAGSVISMREAVLNMSRIDGVGLHNAIRMATETPAEALGIYDQRGSLTVNKKADIIGLDLSNGLDAAFVMKSGKVVFAR